MDHHEAATANIAGARIADRHCEPDRNGGIDGVAAVFENIGADARSLRFLRHDHPVMGDNTLCVYQHIGDALVAARDQRQRDGGDQRETNKASTRHE